MRLIKHDASIDEMLAIKLLGWKWLSFMSRPTKSHELYQTGQEIRCRQFFSPKQLADKRWKDFLASKDARDATGDEPLSYAYCSSNGPARPPEFHILCDG